MKRVLITYKLIKATIVLLILVYFGLRTTSQKIMFAPFLICCIASIGKNLGLLLNKKNIAILFDRLFKVIFFLSWFVFLIVACCILIRDNHCWKILYTVPFWLGGLFFAKRKL